jgi:hypothetical protein
MAPLELLSGIFLNNIRNSPEDELVGSSCLTR